MNFGCSHLVEFKLEAQNVAESEWLTHVGLNERQEKLVLIGATFINLKDDVQNPVRVQVEAAYRGGKKKIIPEVTVVVFTQSIL